VNACGEEQFMEKTHICRVFKLQDFELNFCEIYVRILSRNIDTSGILAMFTHKKIWLNIYNCHLKFILTL